MQRKLLRQRPGALSSPLKILIVLLVILMVAVAVLSALNVNIGPFKSNSLSTLTNTFNQIKGLI